MHHYSRSCDDHGRRIRKKKGRTLIVTLIALPAPILFGREGNAEGNKREAVWREREREREKREPWVILLIDSTFEIETRRKIMARYKKTKDVTDSNDDFDAI